MAPRIGRIFRYATISATLLLLVASSLVFPIDPEINASEHKETAMSYDKTSARDVRRAGIVARLDPEKRDRTVQLLAKSIHSLSQSDIGNLEDLEEDYQYALLLVCDRGIYGTMSDETIEAVDNALEAGFTLKDIREGRGWRDLAYVYGFFNRDVTADEIRQVREGWEAIPNEERGPHYPSYVHAIDAVCKPLSMGELRSGDTVEALELALPLLKSMLLQAPKRGTAFHPPSHAALVLGPLYDRWEGVAPYDAILQKHLGDRSEFITLMSGQLIGGQDEPMSLGRMEQRFYSVSGPFIANALARMNARESVPALRKTLEVYVKKDLGDHAIYYTRRALVALGEREARKWMEALMKDDKEEAMEIAVWLCRNGRGETVEYGQQVLGKIFKCSPDQALKNHFKRLLQMHK